MKIFRGFNLCDDPWSAISMMYARIGDQARLKGKWVTLTDPEMVMAVRCGPTVAIRRKRGG